MKKILLCFVLCICFVIPFMGIASAEDVPTEAEVYNRIVAVKARYPHGTRWTNANYYAWKGGKGGASGCMGFAYLISDAAFGNLPARTIYPKSGDPITISDLRVGDILRLPGHSVVVLEKYSDHILTVEGNYQSKVYWGRWISASQVSRANYYTTRYPVGYTGETKALAPAPAEAKVVKTPVAVKGKIMQFTDIDGHWAIAHIKSCLTTGLLSGSGTEDNMKFNPDDTVTRAQVITALYRAKGSPEVTAEPVFSDLTEDWHKKPIAWASSQGIVNGVSGDVFAPYAEMTREAIITVMYRFANSPEVTADITVFSDYSEISEYSRAAFSWAVKEEIVGGSNNRLNPRGYATRGELSAMLIRLSYAMSRG